MKTPEEPFPDTPRDWILQMLKADECPMRALGDKIAELYIGPLTSACMRMRQTPPHIIEERINGLFANRALTKRYYEKWHASGKRLRDYLWGGIAIEFLTARKEARPSRNEHRDVSNMIDERSLDPAFEYRKGVANEMVRKALQKVKQRCLKEGKEVHWQVLSQYGTENASVRAIEERLGLKKRQGDKQVETMRRWFEEALTELLLEDGVRREDLQEALDEVARVLGRKKKK